MIKRIKPSSQIFFGWWTLLVTGIVSGLGLGFYFYGISALFKPIASELGFSRTLTSVAAGVGRLEGGLEAPLTGWLVDKFGTRWVIFAGVCIVVIGLALMNFITSLWAYYIVWGLITGTGANLGLTIAIDKTLINWFVSKRGLALGLRFVLSSICAIVVLALVTWLVAIQGWRMTCLIWAAVMLAGTPLMLIFVKQKRPEYYGLLPDGASLESSSELDIDAMISSGIEYADRFQEVEFTLRQAMRTPTYWMLFIAYSGHMIIYGGFIVHCIPFLTDMGIGSTVAGGMMGLMVFSSIPSRFLGGFIADRIRKDRLQLLLVGAFLLQAIGIGVFLLNQTLTMAYVLLILYGFGSGVPILLIIIIRGRYFGRKAFGSIHGISSLLASPLSLAAPIYAGWVYDTSGSYATAFVLFVAIAAFSAIIISLVRPPKPPAQITDVHQFI